MWSRESLLNKLLALVIIGIGAASVFIEHDGTFLIFALLLGVPLFFSRKRWIVL